MRSNSKVIVSPVETCWVIRCVSLLDRPLFWVASDEWDADPGRAAVFRREEAAARHLRRERGDARLGFSAEHVVEVVPLEGALTVSREPA